MRNSDPRHFGRRDFGLAIAGWLAVPLLSGAGQMMPQRRIDFDAEQTADLNAISAWLNGVQSLSADFIQMNPSGSIAQGTFYLERPGRLRFEYRPPSALLIVATGGNIYVRNSRLNTVDRTAVSDTPLGLLLSDSINLRRNPSVLAIERKPDSLVLHARSGTNRMSENMLITFAAPQIMLKQWTVTDIQGGKTSVGLSNIRTGVKLDEALFAVPVKTAALRKDPE
jgi:outer membrane lipoprotein-sorting protein